MARASSTNAMENAPVEALPVASGSDVTVHVLPASVERKTRAPATPPVTNHAFFFPCTATQVPLAANAPSPASDGGIFSAPSSIQCAPPSLVAITRKWPSTGSLTAMPCCASQNAMQSKKAFGFVLVNCTDQCSPASLVLKMRDASPGPAASRYAMFASTACTSRKSSASAPGTAAACQVAPSVVRRNVPFVPLAQTTFSLTTLSPRRPAVVLL